MAFCILVDLPIEDKSVIELINDFKLWVGFANQLSFQTAIDKLWCEWL